MLVNKSDGQVVTVDARDGAIGVVETGTGVTGAELTQDGALLLTLTCPGSCIEQHLTAFDLRHKNPLWVERVPIGMTLSEDAIVRSMSTGSRAYSALVEQKGSGIIFEFAKDQLEMSARFDAAIACPRRARSASMRSADSGAIETASDVTSSDGLERGGPARQLSHPAQPPEAQPLRRAEFRRRLPKRGHVRIAGVSYRATSWSTGSARTASSRTMSPSVRCSDRRIRLHQRRRLRRRRQVAALPPHRRLAALCRRDRGGRRASVANSASTPCGPGQRGARESAPADRLRPAQKRAENEVEEKIVAVDKRATSSPSSTRRARLVGGCGRSGG